MCKPGGWPLKFLQFQQCTESQWLLCWVRIIGWPREKPVWRKWAPCLLIALLATQISGKSVISSLAGQDEGEGSRGLTQGLPPPHGVLEPMKKIKAWVLSCHLEASGELNKKGWTTAEEAPSDSEVISEGVTHHAVSTRWLRKGNSISIKIQACEQEALTSMSNIACQELARRKTGFFHALIPVFEVLRY